jgi:hypothetical protein
MALEDSLGIAIALHEICDEKGVPVDQNAA